MVTRPLSGCPHQGHQACVPPHPRSPGLFLVCTTKHGHYQLPANPRAPGGGMLLSLQVMGFIYIQDFYFDFQGHPLSNTLSTMKQKDRRGDERLSFTMTSPFLPCILTKNSNSSQRWSSKPQKPDILKDQTPASDPWTEGAWSDAEEKGPSWRRPSSQRGEGPSERQLHFLERKLTYTRKIKQMQDRFKKWKYWKLHYMLLF